MTVAAADPPGRCRSAPPSRLHVLRRHGDRAGQPGVRRRRSPSRSPTGSDACPDRARRARSRPAGGRAATSASRTTGRPSPARRPSSFTPDLPVRELVFRLVPNGPDSAPAGNRLVVDDVRGDDVAEGRYEAAAAVDPGGLYVVELDGRARGGGVDRGGAGLHPVAGHAAGSTGSGPTTASPGGPAGPRCWRGSRASAGPRTPSSTWAARPRPARSPTPRVSVSAPEDLTVLITGTQAEPSPAAGRPPHLDVDRAGGPRRRRRGRGRSATAERATPGGVRVRVGVLPDGDLEPAQLARGHRRGDRRPRGAPRARSRTTP